VKQPSPTLLAKVAMRQDKSEPRLIPRFPYLLFYSYLPEHGLSHRGRSPTRATLLETVYKTEMVTNSLVAAQQLGVRQLEPGEDGRGAKR
jgi:hypothetical protein